METKSYGPTEAQEAAVKTLSRNGWTYSGGEYWNKPVVKCTCPSGSGGLEWPCPVHAPGEMPDSKELQFEIDHMEDWEGKGETDFSQLICWLKELQRRRAVMAAQPIQVMSDLDEMTPDPDADVIDPGFIAGWNAHRAAKLGKPPAHPDDAAIDRFAIVMKRKMKASRAKGRRGWEVPAEVSGEQLADMLIHHLTKGNDGTFVDVANFCMMLDQRGESPLLLQDAAISACQAAMQPAASLPAGWKLVPIEPTAEMLVAGTLVSEFQEDPGGMYRAMLAATPSSSTEGNHE
ncbi:hypothetical protein [Martelella alba]|uniref:Uncharacterized protein n=1 Tax=Martelella alba TaxID=2590451 RepID=A0ABY2SR32_9HYPH|nr:hypothetical protein [Martelella alba]TKI08642.1 hypothetical protein FCN80_00895 [Martelella alba]